jgi:hypothetical protein
MAQSALAPMEQSQFDDFLCAPVGHERNGMDLSVLSALARMDLDPWREAASLAQMSTQAARGRMQALIAALPEESIAPSDPEALAARLIALLPPRGISNLPARKVSPREASGGWARDHRVVVFLIILSVLLSTQLLMRGALRSTQSGSDNESAHSTTLSPPSP